MDPQHFTAVDALVAIWRRKTTVIIFFLCTITVVGLFTILCEKTYKSEAKLLVRLGRENSALDVTAGLGENQVYSLPMNRNSEINSIVEMIQNKELFGRVVDQLGPDKILKKPKPPGTTTLAGNGGDSSDDAPGMIDHVMQFLADIGVRNDLPPRERAIIKLQKKIDVATSENSNVVSIGFETYDPKVAQEIVEAIVQDYCQQHARAHRAQGGTEFLAEETAAARSDLFESEQKFEAFKNKTQMISIEDQRKVMVERIARLKNELMDTEANIQAVEAEILARKTSASKMDKSQALTQKEGSGNQGIDGMQQELFRLELEYQRILSRYSEEHPDAIQLEAQVKAARQAFADAKADMVEIVEGPSKLYEGAALEIVLREPTLISLKSKAMALSEQLKSVLNQLDEFNSNETEFIRLKREMQLSDDRFQRQSRILQQARMDSSMQENELSNLSVFQPAALNLKPYRPNKLVNLLVGIFAGFFGGCALAALLGFREAFLFHGDSMNTLSGPGNDEFETILDLPVIATIPRQRRTLLSHSNQ